MRRAITPERLFVQVVMGRPRAGVPKVPPSDTPLEAKPTYRTVRVIATSVGPGNRITQVSEFVVEKTARGWVLIRKVVLFDIH